MENNNKHKAVFGIFNNRGDLERAVDSLKADQFGSADISVLLPSESGTKNFAHEKGTKAPEGAATGATGGAVIGGTLGWLAGIGLLAIPGVGPFVAAGPIVAAIAGVGIGGTVGGVTGALVGMGIPEYEAKRYEDYVKEGGMLLSVHVNDSDATKKAEAILESCNAHDISVVSEKHVKFDPKKKPSDSSRMKGTRSST